MSPDDYEDDYDDDSDAGYYAAEAWICRQAELVTYLLSRYHVVLANRCIQGVLAFVGQFPDWDAAQLQQTYVAHRSATERRYADTVGNGQSTRLADRAGPG
jgi:hypothetical protein